MSSFAGSPIDAVLAARSDRAQYDDEDAFPARNMTLETRLGSARLDGYLTAVGAPDERAWPVEHSGYVLGLVKRLDLDETPDHLDADRIDDWPACLAQDPLHVAWPRPEDLLVRVATVSDIARYGATRSNAITAEQLAEELRNGRGSDYLRTFFGKGPACVFAAILERDLAGLLPYPRAPAGSSWADDLRDWLGLVHLDPGRTGAPIDIAVFVYRVADTPPLIRTGNPAAPSFGASEHPLVAPTAVDDVLNPAFCPMPAMPSAGHTVDLAGGADERLRAREVVHATPHLSLSDLYAVGTISSEAPAVASPRKDHIEWVRRETGVTGFAAGTDGDL